MLATCVLDASMINVALPTISQSLGVDASTSVWIVNAYGLTVVVTLLPFSSQVERFGFRRIFSVGLATFTIGALISASSISLPMLLAGRLIQGLGAAALFCLTAGLIRLTFPINQLGRGIGMIAMTVSVGAVVGPSLGAVILTLGGWRWLFLVMLPVGAFVWIIKHHLPDAKGVKRPFDVRSAIESGLGIGLLILGLDFLAIYTWQSLLLIAASAVIIVRLVRRSSTQTAPLFPVDLLRIRPFRYAIGASQLTFSSQMAAFVSLPFFLLDTLERDQLTLGWLMAGWPAGAGVMALVAGRMADRHSIPLLCALGASCMAIGMASIAFMSPGIDNLWVMLCMILCGVGFGFFQTPNNRVLLTTAPRERSGALGGTQAVTRTFGQTVGAALVASALALNQDLGPTYGLIVSVVFALLAVALNVYRQIGLSTSEAA
ncbi:MFS transporter [Orrella marina]|uniref:MFS transporter n=2 Tax=Orrella marina TaxID=2163011 RepID=A0A2R4XMA2_9BURK|nr:MFS transporter [Orrella marina]